jgi:cytochrome c oxidase subunit II
MALSILPWIVFAAIVSLVSLGVGQIAPSWLPTQATAESLLVDELFSFLVTLGTFVFLGVFGVLMFSVLTCQVSRFDSSDGPPIEGNVSLEVVWTAIPIALVIWISVYSYDIYTKMGVLGPMDVVHLHLPEVMESAYAAEMPQTEPVEEIEVMAKQWAWSFHYPEQDVTSAELHLPANHRIKLAMQSEDVLHGFYVPDFRLKQDIIPKRTISLEFTPIREGKYKLTDSQFSGTYFAVMQADVVIESPAVYQAWLSKVAAISPTPPFNQALFEYERDPKEVLNARWSTVIPAQPPLVNQPKAGDS